MLTRWLIPISNFAVINTFPDCHGLLGTHPFQLRTSSLDCWDRSCLWFALLHQTTIWCSSRICSSWSHYLPPYLLPLPFPFLLQHLSWYLIDQLLHFQALLQPQPWQVMMANLVTLISNTASNQTSHSLELGYLLEPSQLPKLSHLSREVHTHVWRLDDYDM